MIDEDIENGKRDFFYIYDMSFFLCSKEQCVLQYYYKDLFLGGKIDPEIGFGLLMHFAKTKKRQNDEEEDKMSGKRPRMG